MTTKIIFFNGPPRCGKDTAAIWTINEFGYPHHWETEIKFDRFAMPLKHGFAGIAAADCVDKFGNVEPYESKKSEVIDWLGVTYRQFQIDLSESFMKPFYGKDIFARLFIQRNKNFRGRAIVVPDSGFVEEVAPIVEAFGEDNVLLIRIFRPGTDFSQDSRSHLPIDLVKNTWDVDNDSSIEDFHNKLDEAIQSFLDEDK